MSEKQDEKIAEKVKAEPKQEQDDGLSIRDFDKDFMKMYMDEPFLGSISMRISKMKDNKMPTAYITYKNILADSKRKDIMMGFNTKFLNSMEQNHRVGVFKHELFHFIFQHLFNRSTSDKRYHQLQNIAQDLAINSIIGEENLPGIVLIPGKRPINHKTGQPEDNAYADYIANAEPMHSAEKYFNDLLKIQKEEQEKNGGVGGEGEIIIDAGGVQTLDDHDVWDDLPEEVKEELRNKAQQIVGDATKKADRDNQWGSIPQEMREEIRKIISKEVDWRSILKSFMGRVRSTSVDSTITKINKKMPMMAPGMKRKTVSKFCVFVDQSGSMSNEDIAMLFGEIENLAKHVELDVFYFDTQVDEENQIKWKKGKPAPKIQRTRCGGTMFQCIADFLNKSENRRRWSGAIIATDGYSEMPSATPGTKLLWVIVPGGTTQHIRPHDLYCKMKESRAWGQK